MSVGIRQSNQYYPFGMMFAESSNKVQDYKYNGKELDQMHGLNHYDYSARQYDPARLQFTTMDPLSEKFYSWSPYVYCYNNPINAIDPDGRAAWWIKGIAGGLIDEGAQVAVGMALGESFGNAVLNIDITSVGASALVSATTFSGASEAKKIGIIAGDALVDISVGGEVTTAEFVGGTKTSTAISIDAVASFLPGMGTNKLVKDFNEALTHDLTSSAARGNIHVKNSYKNAEKVINSSSFQSTVDATTSFVGGVIGEETKNGLKTNNTSKAWPGKNGTTLPSDNTRVRSEKIRNDYEDDPLYVK